ncbi:hypothetical protein [Amycolatopsis sp. CA-230715]|uniref:hypothetical protein n=1 Tax=Amycolatopsis sp. CA-230715 TaxID=2745196 RepID=UPI001C02CAA7|nr:hypothetical protein [Amycolatopsis sp. CA-230715]QWF78876.1 hypothetical protein HUW46_02274 [Amycolatopsis sp. CA-230715]
MGNVTRRAILTGAVAVGGSLAVPTAARADFAGPHRLWHWVETMAGFGPRFTGGPAHRRWIDYLERSLGSFGLRVQRFPTPLKYWDARSWSLTVTDARGQRHRIPVASYWPYSGSTPPRGITAELVDVGTGTAGAVAGRIVVADRVVAKRTLGEFADLVVHAKPPSLLEDARDEDYSRLWAGIPPAPDLRLAKERGAVGMIGVLDLAPEDARGQFSPHQQPHAGLPAVQLDRDQGARLRELLARGPVTATLTLIADTDDAASIDYLAAELPGNGRGPGTVLVLTHSDGQNGVEENGAAAVLAMARHFTRIPRSRRDRDLCFAFSPAHMAAPDAAVDPGEWLERNPALRRRIAAVVVPEHLGTTQWDDSRGTGRWLPTGKPELLTLGVGNDDRLTELVARELDAGDLVRTTVAKPYNGTLYGEATGPYRLGIPSVTAISGPAYLLRVSPGAELGRLDPALLHRQARFVTGLTAKLASAPWLGSPR